MSYKDLIDAWDHSRKEWQEYRVEASSIFAQITRAIRNYFAFPNPESQLKTIPLSDDKRKENMMYTIMGALNFEDDGWTSMGLLIVLEKENMISPKDAYKLGVFIKKASDIWLVKCPQDSTPIEISATPTEDELVKVAKQIHSILLTTIKDTLPRWLNQK